MSDKRELDKWNFNNDGTPAEPLEPGAIPDRTTGQDMRIRATNTFDPDTRRFDGKLGDLTTVEVDGATRLVAKQNLEGYQSEDDRVAPGRYTPTAEDPLPEYANAPTELQERVSENEFEVFASNIETLEDRSLYTQKESDQVHAGWDYWTQEVQFAVVEVLGKRQEGEDITEVYEKIEALLSPRGKSNFENGIQKLPDKITGALYE